MSALSTRRICAARMRLWKRALYVARSCWKDFDMLKKELGKSGIMLPPVMFGGNVFGWTADVAMSFKLLDALMEAALNAIDTADVYSRWVPGHTGGESE